MGVWAQLVRLQHGRRRLLGQGWLCQGQWRRVDVRARLLGQARRGQLLQGAAQQDDLDIGARQQGVGPACAHAIHKRGWHQSQATEPDGLAEGELHTCSTY